MFNWFHRKKENQEVTKTETANLTNATDESLSPEQEQQQEESTTPTQEDYLEWAKAAFANIQKQKQQQSTDHQIVTSESKSSPPTSAVETEENVAVSVAEAEITTTEAIVQQEAIKDLESANLTTTPTTPAETDQETETITDKTPAWMQKSERLEELKETAIETKEELDEDFIWSAQVLASQGRKAEDVTEEEFAWLKKLRQGLGKTRRSLVNQLKSVVGQGPLSSEAVMEIEALLLSADVGIEATDYIINTLQDKLKEEALPPEEAIAYLKQILQDLLDQPLQKLAKIEFSPEEGKLNVWLLTGVNGVGKTTTIGKLAHLAQTSGYNCVIAAADTFRAAAVEQVKVWGERTNTPVIANPGKNTDPAAVVFDAISAAEARSADILLVDTAGRLQNKKNLMAELAKIRRIIDKKAENADIESLLVLDANLGQNGLKQAQVFAEVADLTGVILTKLDGTAKGGVALAIAQQLNLPIRFIGVGEGLEDLRPFSSYEFVEALLSG
jgi:fused signal recognition particle receptor